MQQGPDIGFILTNLTPCHFYQQWLNTSCLIYIYQNMICGASSRKPYNVRETIFFHFSRSEFSKILCFKSIYNLPITFPPPTKNKMMESLKFSFPSVFLASWAIHMISNFIRVTWWRTTYDIKTRLKGRFSSGLESTLEIKYLKSFIGKQLWDIYEK